MAEIPNFLKLSQIPVNYLQEVETDVLDPVIFNEGSGATTDGFCRFTLQNKGFLHSHSKLLLSLTPAATVARAFYPPNVGVNSIIKSAVLKVGNKVLNEISDWNKFMALKSSHISCENNVERELYTTGRFMNHKFIYTNGETRNASGYGLANGREDYIDNDLLQMPFALMEGGSPAQSPSYSVDLSDLFPFLKVHSLPLYMIDEPINIELTFVPPAQQRVTIANGDTAAQDFVIDRNELKFVADYIFYSPSTDAMQQFAEQNKNMSFSFVDYRSATTTVSATTLQSATVRNIGMANRQVTKVLTAFFSLDASETAILNSYAMKGPEVGTAANLDKTGTIEWNIRYNDRFEYSSNVANVARLHNLTTDADGMIFQTRSEYSGQGGGFAIASLFEGMDENGQLQSQMFMLANKLTGGRVGSRGIEIHVKVNNLTELGTDGIMLNWSEYLRVANLSGGVIDIYNV